MCRRGLADAHSPQSTPPSRASWRCITRYGFAAVGRLQGAARSGARTVALSAFRNSRRETASYAANCFEAGIGSRRIGAKLDGYAGRIRSVALQGGLMIRFAMLILCALASAASLARLLRPCRAPTLRRIARLSAYHHSVAPLAVSRGAEPQMSSSHIAYGPCDRILQTLSDMLMPLGFVAPMNRHIFGLWLAVMQQSGDNCAQRPCRRLRPDYIRRELAVGGVTGVCSRWFTILGAASCQSALVGVRDRQSRLAANTAIWSLEAICAMIEMRFRRARHNFGASRG